MKHKSSCRILPIVGALICGWAAVTASAETVTQKWVQRYNGPASKADYGFAVAVDAKGNAIVTGSSMNASTAPEMATVKYDVNDGHLLWEKRYASTEGAGQIVRVDKAGDVIVAGSSGTFSNRDVYVVKYSGVDGHILWEKTYAGPANLPDSAAGLLLDGNGNVLILIRSASAEEFIGYTRPLYDFYTAKYNGDTGQLIWQKFYKGSVDRMDYARDLVLDGNGNVIVVGETDLSATESAAHMIKYAAADGHTLWERNYSALQGGNATIPAHVAIDAYGDIAIVGDKRDTANSDFAAYAAKFSGTDGALLWDVYPTFTLAADRGPGVAFDALGNLFAAFSEYVPNAPQRCHLLKYSGATGQSLWGKIAPRAIATFPNLLVDNNGHPILTYGGFDNSQISGIYNVKYNGPNGAILWETFYEGLTNGDDYPGDLFPVALGRDGSMVVTGYGRSGVGIESHQNDYITIRYTVKNRQGGAINGVLGSTTFTVRHSPNPATNTAAKTIGPARATASVATDDELGAFLEFVAVQLSQVPGLEVQVQYSTLPSDHDSWFALENGNKGRLQRDPNTNVFIAKSSDFPHIPNVYFRAKIKAPGYEETFSNVVGPFDLRQKPQTLPATGFRVFGDDFPSRVFAGQQLIFTAGQSSDASGLKVRVQYSFSPLVESSWTDLPDGTMHPEFNYYIVLSNSYPTGSEIYFRAISSAPGAIDSISNHIGPWTLTNNDLPAVQINLAENQTFSRNSSVRIPVTATDSNGISRVELYVDGELQSVTANAPYSFDLRGIEPGPHSLVAFAYDNFGSPNVSNVIERITLTDARFTIYNRTSDGAWNDASGWSPQSVPGANDIVEISNGRTVSLNGSVSVRMLFLRSGKVTGPGTLNVANQFSWLSGQLDSFTLNIGADARFLSFSDADKTLNNATVNNAGTFVVAGKGVSGNKGTTLNNTGTFTFAGQLSETVRGTVPTATFGTATLNGGLLRIAGGKFVAPHFTQNNGELKLGTHLIGNDGNTLIGNDGNTLIGNDGNTLIGNDGNTLIGNDGNTLIGNDGNTLAALNGAGFISEQGGALISDNGAAFNLSGGTITGFGRIDYPNFQHNGGAFHPGNSPGSVDITGNYTQGAGASLILEIGGTNGFAGDYDMVAVKGIATLAGDLIVRSINGYQSGGFGAVPLGYGSVAGKFKSVTANAKVTLGAKGALIRVDGANPPLPRALNIATRLQIQSGDNALFAGFIVTGPAGSTKKVLIRGIGPSLAQFGVSGTIPDPFLELHTSSATITNDDWQQAPNANEIPNGFAPGDSKESIIIATLAPGNYSSILKGAHGETGVGLAEVYDLEPDSAAQLANIATRGFVQTGDNVLIGGFIVSGNQPAKVLVRAIGPSLSTLLPGTLQDTTLELHDSNGGAISNDNWRDNQEAEIIATTIPPSHDKEAAVLATLVPGNYTAVVRGKDDTTGIAVVEAYNLQ